MWNQLSSLTQQLLDKAEAGLDDALNSASETRQHVSAYISEESGAQPSSVTYSAEGMPTLLESSASEADRFSVSKNTSKDLCIENKRLKSRLQAVEAAAADALGEIEDMKEQLNVALRLKQVAEGEVRQAMSQLSKLREQQTKLISEAAELRSTVQKLEKRLAETKHEAAAAEPPRVARSTTDAVMTTSEEEVAAMRAKLLKAKKQFQVLKRQAADANEARDAAIAECDRLRSVVEGQQGNKSAVQTGSNRSIGTIPADLSQLQQQVHLMQQQLTEERSAHASLLRESQTAVAQQADIADVLRRELEAERASNAEQLAAERARAREIEDALQLMKNAQDVAAESAASLQQKQQELDLAFKKAQEEAAKAEALAASLHAADAKLIELKSSKNAEIAALQGQLQAMEAAASRYVAREQVENLELQMASLDSQLQDALSSRDAADFKVQLARGADQRSSAEADLSCAPEEQLQVAQEFLVSEVKDLKRELDTACNALIAKDQALQELAAHKEQAVSLQQELDEARREAQKLAAALEGAASASSELDFLKAHMLELEDARRVLEERTLTSGTLQQKAESIFGQTSISDTQPCSDVQDSEGAAIGKKGPASRKSRRKGARTVRLAADGPSTPTAGAGNKQHEAELQSEVEKLQAELLQQQHCIRQLEAQLAESKTEKHLRGPADGMEKETLVTDLEAQQEACVVLQIGIDATSNEHATQVANLAVQLEEEAAVNEASLARYAQRVEKLEEQLKAAEAAGRASMEMLQPHHAEQAAIVQGSAADEVASATLSRNAELDTLQQNHTHQVEMLKAEMKAAEEETEAKVAQLQADYAKHIAEMEASVTALQKRNIAATECAQRLVGLGVQHAEQMAELAEELCSARQLAASQAESIELEVQLAEAAQGQAQAAQQIADLRSKLEVAEGEAASAKASEEAANKALEEAKEALQQRDSELDVLRDGARAESQLAACAVRDAQERAKRAEGKAADVEQQLCKAQQEAEQVQDSLHQQLLTAQANLEQVSDANSSLQSQLSVLQQQLVQQEADAAAASDSLREELQKASLEAVAAASEGARKEGVMEARADAALRVQELEGRVVEAERARKEAEQALVQLKLQADAAEKLEADMASATATKFALQTEVETVSQQLVTARQQLNATTKELLQHQQHAEQRQQRFLVVQAGFKRREQEMVAELTSLRQAVDAAQEAAAEAAQRAGHAEQEMQAALEDRKSAFEKLDALEEIRSAATAELASVQCQLARHASQLSAVEAELDAERAAHMAAASSRDQMVSAHQQQLAQQLADQERAVAHKVGQLELQLKEIRNQLIEAKSRAEAAELAKIELSLQLAELAASTELADVGNVDGRSKGLPRLASHSPLSGGNVAEDAELPVSTSAGSAGLSADQTATLVELDLLHHRAETAELAAAAANRRAAAAEALVDKLKVDLSDAQKRSKDLGWQVKMMAGGGAGGAAAAGQQGEASSSRAITQAGRVAGMMDLFGCTMNYNRKK